MQILVIAATSFEINRLPRDTAGVEILVTGVGIPSTMYHLQKKLHEVKPRLVLQAGIAGSFSPGIGLGEVVLVKQDTFADIGMEEGGNFTSIFDSGFADRNEKPFVDGWLVNRNDMIAVSGFRAVNAVTVNKVGDSRLQRAQVSAVFSPEIESMEGAAMHYVCLQENIPFLQLRSISNFVGERDKGKWKLEESIVQLNTALGLLVETSLQQFHR